MADPQGLIASPEDSKLVNEATLKATLNDLLDTIRSEIRSSEGRMKTMVEQLTTRVTNLEIAKSRPSSPTLQQSKQQATLQQSTPSTPEQATQPATQQKQESEKSAEKATGNSSSSTINTSLLPAAPHQAAKQLSREPAFHCSSSIRLISYGCNSFRLLFLATKHYHDALLASPLGYMEYAQDMDATGEG